VKRLFSAALAAVLAAALLAAPPAAAQARVTAAPEGVVVDIVDTDLSAAVQALAQHLDRPVFFSAMGPVRVTLRLPRPIPPSDVLGLLRNLLEANGHELVEVPGGYRAQQKAAAAPPAPPAATGPPARFAGAPGEMQLFVIQLRHARAADVAATVNALYGRGGAVGELGDPGSGTLSDQLRDNRVAAGQYGTPGPGGGADAAGAGAGTLRGPLVMVPDARTNSLLVRTTPASFQLIAEAVQRLDVRPLQVLIEVVIAEVRRSSSFDLGLASFLDTTAVRGHPGTSVFGTTQGLGGLGDFALKVMHVGGADLNLTLSAAANRGDVTVVSRPVVLTANNEAARVLVGDQRPFVQLQRTLPTDNGVRDQVVQYKDVGTQLDVRPTISADGYVMLEVTQQVNDATDTESGVAGAPVISTRSVATHLLVKDGQTAVLGGLAGRQRTSSRGGVPVLSRLPLIGWVFGHTRRTSAETELFVFLTPRVLRDDAAMDSAAAQVQGSAPRVGKAVRGLRPFAAPAQPKRRGPVPAPAQPPAAPPAAPAPAAGESRR